MDLASPDGQVKTGAARLILNLLGGRRMFGVILRGRHDPLGFKNQDLHDQLLGAICRDGGSEMTGPPIFIIQPQNQFLAYGGGATLTSLATGTTPITYQWYYDEGQLPGEVSPNLTIGPITESGHRYQVVATNLYGQAISQIALVMLDGFGPVRTRWFNDIPEMQADPHTTWEVGRTLNMYGLDGLVSGWDLVMKDTEAGALLVWNGDTVLETDDHLAWLVQNFRAP